jgi:hypothetical protein
MRCSEAGGHSAFEFIIRPLLFLTCNMQMRGLTPALLLLLAGCGQAFLPKATSKSVSTQDVVGTWTFPSEDKKTTVFISFAPSGDYTQTNISTGGLTNVYGGKWSLAGANIHVSAFFVPWSGKREDQSWYVTDGLSRKYEVFGGDYGDPDSWTRFTYVGP